MFNINLLRMARFSRTHVILIFILSFLLLKIYCQDTIPNVLLLGEDSINFMFAGISETRNDNRKLIINKEIKDKFSQLFLIEESFKYGFDSLKNVGVIFSPDKRLKIFTWNIPFSTGTHLYDGFVLYKQKKTDTVFIYPLFDDSDNILNPEQKQLTNKNWYGALYYEIVEKKFDKKKSYVLLGYDLNNLFTNKKVIDIVYFDESVFPKFGKQVFDMGDKTQNRVIFEYSTQAAMSLRYNQKLKMIVFDHLSPFESKYQGVYQFYGPDFSYDGLEFNKGIWNLVKDVDARN